MNSKNYSIQALRAIAAIFVVIDHTLTQFNLYNDKAGYIGKVLKNSETLGLIGVYIFFIISGYIMSMTTSNKKGGMDSALTFIKKRLFRIYPTYWVWLSILVLLWMSGLALRSHYYSLDKVISSYILIPFSDNHSTSINPILSQGWTLIYEMFFYCIFAMLIFLKASENRMIAITIMVFFTFNRLGAYSFFTDDLSQFFNNWVFFFFPAGMLFFKYKDKVHCLFSKGIATTLLHLLSTTLITYTILRASNSNIEILKVVCAALVFTSFYVSSIRNKTLLTLGDASYSIYLSHTFIVMAYGIISKNNPFSSTVLLSLALPVMILCVLFGTAAYYLIEKRIQKIITTKLIRNTGKVKLTS